jgi:uncharacterized membrane protein
VAEKLTPQIAANLMYKSMTTGVSSAVLDRYGGHAAVQKAYLDSGGQMSLNAIPKATMEVLANQVAKQGYGNMSALAVAGVPFTEATAQAMRSHGHTDATIAEVADRVRNFDYYSSQRGTVADNRNKNDTGLVDTGGSGFMGSGGGITGGSLVDDGSSLQNTTAGDQTFWRPVYGPDGKMYSSPAAAAAAGVTNFTYEKPQAAGPGLIDGADNLNTGFMQSVPASATGDVNSGGLINDANQQLFKLGAPRVRLPSNVRNPFAT